MPVKAISRSPSRVRAELKRFGFFHATGLPWIEAMHEEEGQIQAPVNELGSWGHDDKWTIVILKNGEVWLCKNNGEVPDEFRIFIREICPRGRGAIISCRDGRILCAEHVAERFFNPYAFCNGHADPVPKPE